VARNIVDEINNRRISAKQLRFDADLVVANAKIQVERIILEQN
jgi:hypothetical protein